MKRIPFKEVQASESTAAVQRQKRQTLRIVLVLLLAFALLMLAVNYAHGNRNSCIGILLLVAILIGELICTHFFTDAAKIFFVGKALILTCFFFYFLLGSDAGGEALWFWFLAIPSFSLYLCGLYWGFLETLYGGILLVLLLWTPLRHQILTASTQFLVKLPMIYLVISFSSLAITWALTKMQLEQQEATRKIGVKLTEYTERRKVDRMTGLLNRDWAEDEIRESLRTHTRGAFFFLDIDNFKLVNDLLGHQAGDRMLSDFASHLRQVFGDGAIPGRLGGDEFIAFVPDYPDLEALSQLSQSMLRRTLQMTNEPSLVDKIGVSIGIALAPEDGTDFDSLYRCADKAQYYAKRNGKRSYSFYQHEMGLPARLNSGADIATLRRMLLEFQREPGAFFVEYGIYSKVYQFLCRNMDRTQENAQIVLFTLTDPEGACTPLAEAYGALRDCIRRDLRTGDLLMEFSRNQLAVLLVSCSETDCAAVADRILADYRKANPTQEKLSVQWERDSLRSESKAT